MYLAVPGSGSANAPSPGRTADPVARAVSGHPLDQPPHRSCSSTYKAIRYYTGRINYWRSKMGVEHMSPRAHGRPTGGACPRYLAHVLQRKAYAARKTYLRWQRTVGRVVQRLDRVLASTPLAGTGRDLEDIARRYHVSPYFIVAVAATESSIGRAACASNSKNIWGLSSCGSGWYVPQFSSWRSAYEFFAAFVNRQWPGHSSPWSFRGYAACSDCWARKVSSWMHTLFGVAAETRYP